MRKMVDFPQNTSFFMFALGEYPEIRKILICEEVFPRDVDGVSVLPWKEFLQNLKSHVN